MQKLVLPSRKKQERAANYYSPHASPDRDVYRLLVLYRQLDRAQLGLMGVLGVAETTVHQTKDAGNDKRNLSGLSIGEPHILLSEIPGRREKVLGGSWGDPTLTPLKELV